MRSRENVFTIFSHFDGAKIMHISELIAIFAKKFSENMLIYNTTYQIEADEEQLFLIWMQEYYLPEVEKDGRLKSPRIARILSHREEGSSCFSVQFEVDSSATLHHWHQEVGIRLNEELVRIFKEKVVGFPTLMEVLL